MKFKVSMIILLSLVGIGCSSGRTMVDRGVDLSTYSVTTVYDSEAASFIELELEELFEEIGFRSVGENQIDRYAEGEVLAARYREITNPAGTAVTLRVLLEDGVTDKTLVTVEGFGSSFGFLQTAREKAWRKVRQDLTEVFQEAGLDLKD